MKWGYNSTDVFAFVGFEGNDDFFAFVVVILVAIYPGPDSDLSIREVG